MALSAAGAWLFLNHAVLYLDGGPLPAVPRESYLLTTAALYLFLRSLSLVAGTRDARAAARCPACGALVPAGASAEGAPPAAVRESARAAPARGPRIARKAWRPPWMADR